MKRAMFHSIMALMVMLGLTLAMATPVAAQAIGGNKMLDPEFERDEYYVGDTVYYVITVRNPDTNPEPITIINIWDEFPDGSEYYFVEDTPTVFAVGQQRTYKTSYTIMAGDIEYVTDAPGRDPYYGVRNKVFAEYAQVGLPPWATEHITEVNRRPVGGIAHPVSRLALLAPWIVLAGLVAGAAVFVWSRRAQARA